MPISWSASWPARWRSRPGRDSWPSSSSPLGKGWLEALYAAAALTFSSAIIIKLLSGKRELDLLHGRIAVGFLIVLIGNPLVVMAIMGYMGYRKRTGFLAGLTVVQISEFSIIFVAMGISLGHVDQGVLGLTTLIGLITIELPT